MSNALAAPTLRLRRRALTLGLILPAALSAGPSTAQTRVTLASGYPDGNYHTQILRRFADRVRERTSGGLDIAVHSNGSLIRLPDIRRAVQTAQTAFGEILLANHGNEDPIFEADSVPFLARGLAEARRLYDAQKPMLDERFGRQGIVMLYSAPWPGNGIFSRRPLERLRDMAGMRFRAYNTLTGRFAELVGAHPVTVQVPELPMAFTTGVAEVMISSAPIVVNTRGWDYGRHFYDLRAFNPRSAVLVNARSFRALPESVRLAVQEAAAEAEALGWQTCAEEETRSVATLAENGIVVSQPTPDMLREAEQIGETLISAWAQRAGADGTTLRRAVGR